MRNTLFQTVATSLAVLTIGVSLATTPVLAGARHGSGGGSHHVAGVHRGGAGLQYAGHGYRGGGNYGGGNYGGGGYYSGGGYYGGCNQGYYNQGYYNQGCGPGIAAGILGSFLGL